ncbi:MAG: VanZ family protein [Salinibacter sp.]
MAHFPSLSTTHYRWLAVLWTGAIILACSLPAASFAGVQPGVGADKVVHVVLFAGFGGLWMRAFCPPDVGWTRVRSRGGRLFLVGALFASGSEVYQQLLPLRRMADPYDALADVVGLLFGILLYGAYVRWGTSKEPSPS